MVMLGRANSRMKDFHDIWVLSKSHALAGDDKARRALAALPPNAAGASLLPDARFVLEIKAQTLIFMR